MNLSEFYNYKNRLMQDLLSNMDIVQLIDPDATAQTASSLAYTQVFPYEYLPETADYGKTFICFDVDVQKIYDNLRLYPYLYIWVFTHKSLMRLNGGGVRVDNLCSEITKMLNGNLNYGIGALDFLSSKRFAPISDFQGKVLTFSATEYNRQFNPKKTIPTSRNV